MLFKGADSLRECVRECVRIGIGSWVCVGPRGEAGMGWSLFSSVSWSDSPTIAVLGKKREAMITLWFLNELIRTEDGGSITRMEATRP
jgi:hypothetical protein